MQFLYLKASHLFSQLNDFSYISSIEAESNINDWDILDVALSSPARFLVFDSSAADNQVIALSENVNFLLH